jgi:hypothetical protein
MERCPRAVRPSGEGGLGLGLHVVVLPGVGADELLKAGGVAVSDQQGDRLVDRLEKAVGFAKTAGRLNRDEEARWLWAQVYQVLGHRTLDCSVRSLGTVCKISFRGFFWQATGVFRSWQSSTE